MKALTRWEPFSELVSLRQAMDRLSEDSFVRPSHLWSIFSDREYLPLDMYQTPDDVVLKASLPGIKPEEVEITLQGTTIDHQRREERGAGG
ncbi:MAG: Hsp20/alpha crystallin family protein [Dehalococcoidia bacterium]